MNFTRFNIFVFIFFNYFLINVTITKINTSKIERQPNTRTFVWDCDNVTEINFEDGFKINEILNDEIEKKNKNDSIEIVSQKIEHESNNMIFVQDNDNIIESKLK
jgi:hypothetical protein